jgi:hypothetical protein
MICLPLLFSYRAFTRHRPGQAQPVFAVNPWAERQLPAGLKTLERFETDGARNPDERQF